MKTIREQFEEIWPVPEGVYWRDSKGRYGCHSVSDVYAMDAHNIRLETFTRCQESMGPVLSLVEEMVKDLEWMNEKNEDHHLIHQIEYAKEIIGVFK